MLVVLISSLGGGTNCHAVIDVLHLGSASFLKVGGFVVMLSVLCKDDTSAAISPQLSFVIVAQELVFV